MQGPEEAARGHDEKRGGGRPRAAAALLLSALLALPAACRPEGPAATETERALGAGASADAAGAAATDRRGATTRPTAITPGAAGSNAPTHAFAGLDESVLALPDTALDDEAVLRRFEVPADTAERFAIRWVDASGELPGPAHVCLALPWLDGGDREVGRVFVLTDLDACRSWDDVVRESRRIAAATDGALDAGGRVDGPVLRERTKRSARHFFTLAVSAWSFQHPIRDGLGGLPFWLLTPERLPDDSPAERLRPTAVFPAGNAEGLVEVVRYEGPGGGFLFSHHAARRVEPAALAWRFEPADVLRDWRTTIRTRHAMDPSAAVQELAGVWARTLDGGPP